MNESGPGPKDPIDDYDSKHGRPEATPAKPNVSEADLTGDKLNPVRDDAPAFSNLKQA